MYVINGIFVLLSAEPMNCVIADCGDDMPCW